MLIGVARILKENFQRSEDLVARYGEEEFVCVLPHASFEQARASAERLVQAVARADFPGLGLLPQPVTISVGFAVTQPGTNASADQLFRVADGLLYEAKARGKNQAVGNDLDPARGLSQVG